MKVMMAYPAFFGSFTTFFPELKIVKNKEDVDTSDLIIFSGGEDIDPGIYSEENRHSYGINPKRDKIELEILDWSLNAGVKILGICRGHQLINAYLGGKLVQDIDTELMRGHNSMHKLYEDKSQIFFANKVVNSLHHQGVIKLGGGLKPVAWYGGVCEVTNGKNIFSVQYHPEFMGDKKFFDNIKEWISE